MSTADHSTASSGGARIYSREVVLLMCVISLLVLVAITAFLSRMYHKKVHTLADVWFAQGEADTRAGNVNASLADYRNALAYNPSNSRFQFHLATALAASQRPDEARSYLLNLLSESPGSGEVNLELARIAVHNNSLPDALRYYQGAIYGEWTEDPITMRWQVRRELCDYLLGRGAVSEAAPEVIALADNTPTDDSPRMKIVGQLLIRTRQWTRAQETYRSLLEANPKDEASLAGASQSAFELGQYAVAMENFDHLTPERRAQPDIAGSFEMSRRVLAANPFSSGLSAEVRAQRGQSALTLALTQIQNCTRENGESLQETTPRTDLQKLFARGQNMQTVWSQRNLQKFPEQLDAAMAFVFDVENAVAKTCGEPQGDDRALWLLGRSLQVVNR
jgi:tetratricopeptide (TPR) repeat protein